jgi:DNA-binding FadR family transcriptional regulator
MPSNWSDNLLTEPSVVLGDVERRRVVAFRAVLVSRSYEQVVEQVQEGIRGGALRPGQRLPTERALSETFGVSRAVVREALKVLSSMGLIESRQGSGTFVRANPVPSITRALILSATPEEESLLALFEVREPLEAMAARLAAERRSPEQVERIVAGARATRRAAEIDDGLLFSEGDQTLHGTIFEAATNPYLASVASAVRELLARALHLVVSLTGTMATAAEHHLGIAGAIERGDAEAAGELMAAHIRYNADALREMLAAGHEFGPPGRWAADTVLARSALDGRPRRHGAVGGRVR